MMIGVLSDTHGQVDTTRQAVRMFESLEVELLIHCGDVGPPTIVSLLAPWPTHFVLGNVDNPRVLKDIIDRTGHTYHDRFGTLAVDGKQIAFLHGDDESLFRQTIQSGRFDLVCCGHTHLAESAVYGRTLVLNPGAMVRTPQPSVAAVRLPELEVIPIAL